MNRRVVGSILLLTSMWVLYEAKQAPWWYGEPNYGHGWSAHQLREFLDFIGVIMGVLRPLALIASGVAVVTAWVPAVQRGTEPAANTTVMTMLLLVLPALLIARTPQLRELGLQIGPAWIHVILAAVSGFAGGLMLRRAGR